MALNRRGGGGVAGGGGGWGRGEGVDRPVCRQGAGRGIVKLLDTNVFVYAQGAPHPYREPCRAVLGQAQERPDAYGVDVEALQELLDVYSRRGQRTLAVEIVNDVLDSLPEPFPITSREIHEVTDIIVAHPGLSPPDALPRAV